MGGDVDLAAIGALLADPARATILLELLGGEPIAAGELARRAGLSPSGASNHLRKLLAAGLLEVFAVGRTRLIASPRQTSRRRSKRWPGLPPGRGRKRSVR
jgi:DNA-binding transcriptional ArsR family regulator